MNKFFLFSKNRFCKIFTLLFCLITINTFLYSNNDKESKDLVNKTIILHKDKAPLLINFPNPFSHQTYIYIRLPFKNSCILKIYDIFGNIVKEYVLEGDENIVVWDGKNNNNQSVSKGVYVCVLEFEGIRLTRKIGYIK